MKSAFQQLSPSVALKNEKKQKNPDLFGTTNPFTVTYIDYRGRTVYPFRRIFRQKVGGRIMLYLRAISGIDVVNFP